MARELKCARRNGKIQLTRTETIEITDDQLLERLQVLQNRLYNCRLNMQRMQETEAELLSEIETLKGILAKQLQEQTQ